MSGRDSDIDCLIADAISEPTDSLSKQIEELETRISEDKKSRNTERFVYIATMFFLVDGIMFPHIGVIILIPLFIFELIILSIIAETLEVKIAMRFLKALIRKYQKK